MIFRENLNFFDPHLHPSIMKNDHKLLKLYTHVNS